MLSGHRVSDGFMHYFQNWEGKFDLFFADMSDELTRASLYFASRMECAGQTYCQCL